MKLLVVLALVLNTATVLLASKSDIRKICEGADVTIRTVKDLKELSHEAFDYVQRDFDRVCPDQLNEWFKALASIVSHYNVCDRESAQKIGEFYENYLVNYDEKYSGKNLNQIPKPLVQFAIAFGLKVTSRCREIMLDVLGRKELAEKSDFALVSKWTDERGSIAQLLDPLVKPTEILVPADLLAMLPDSDFATKFHDQLFEGQSEIVFIKEVCARRFEPVYKELFMPIAVLIKNGFTYKSFSLSKGIKFQPEVAKKSALWSRIMFLCEFVKTVQVDAEQSEEIIKSDKRLKKVSKNFPYYYPPEDWPKIDQVLARTDFRIKSAVESFKLGRIEQDHLREQLIKQGWSLMATKLNYDHYKGQAKEFLEQLRRQAEGANEEESRELTKINHLLVDLLESKDETKLHQLLRQAADKTLTMAGKVDRLINKFVSHLINYVVIGGLVSWAAVKHSPRLLLPFDNSPEKVTESLLKKYNH